IALKRYEQAIDTFKYLLKISNRHQLAVNGLIWAYCSNENFEEAKALMQELKERSSNEYIAGTQLGLSAAWLGDADTAFDYLEKAYEERDIIYDIKYAPYVPALLRNDPRFQKLLDRIGFPK
ncbi:MAG: tetratricopeptide repeat protein, partial [Chitinophagaceae bacterium]